MSKSLYDDLIGDAEFDADCPACGENLKISPNKAGTTVTCPHCGARIELENGSNGFDELRNTLDDFEKTLDNF